MKILDKLKAIGINIPKLKEVGVLKFSSLISVDRSIHVAGSVVVINPDKLSGKQRRGLKQIIREEVLEEAGAIIDESNEPIVGAVIKALPTMDEAARKFIPIIPSSDIPLLNACLFLRHKWKNLGENVEDLKGQITRVYGARGRNFANLVSAGYLEEWFGPLYDELLKAYPDDPAAAKARFQIHYNVILTDLPWTEFVATGHRAADVTAHIVKKMMHNLENGVRHLNVHGLGEKNVTKIEQVLPDILKQTGASVARTERDPTRIFVRLEIPPTP